MYQQTKRDVFQSARMDFVEPSATKPEEPVVDSASTDDEQHQFRLEELRRRVQDGSYTVDALEVSKALLRALSAGR